MPSRRTSWPGSPASSRSFSSCQIGLTMSATGRSGLGNAAAGMPDCAATSCAAPNSVNTAATTAVIVARMIAIELGLGLQRNWGCIHSLATLSFSGAKYPQQSTLGLVWAPRAECNPYGDSAPHPEQTGTRPQRQAGGLGGAWVGRTVLDCPHRGPPPLDREVKSRRKENPEWPEARFADRQGTESEQRRNGAKSCRSTPEAVPAYDR